MVGIIYVYVDTLFGFYVVGFCFVVVVVVCLFGWLAGWLVFLLLFVCLFVCLVVVCFCFFA